MTRPETELFGQICMFLTREFFDVEIQTKIAPSKAREKLIFRVFIPKLRGPPKKLKKIKKGKNCMENPGKRTESYNFFPF